MTGIFEPSGMLACAVAGVVTYGAGQVAAIAAGKAAVAAGIKRSRKESPAGATALPAKRPSAAEAASHAAAAACILKLPPCPPQSCRILTLISDRDGDEQLYSIHAVPHDPRHESTIWELKNLTRGAAYLVSCSQTDRWGCTCPGSAKQSRYGDCKHIRAFRQIQAITAAGCFVDELGLPMDKHSAASLELGQADELERGHRSEHPDAVVDCPF